MKEFKIRVNDNDYNVVLDNAGENVLNVDVNGQSYIVEVENVAKDKQKSTLTRMIKPATPKPAETPVAAPVRPVAATASGAGATVKSPLPGVILEVAVNKGDVVKTGQKLFVLEAMKIENAINADADGKVLEVNVQKGDSVLEGAILAVIG
jgi:biotin carboxyl carrier protein